VNSTANHRSPLEWKHLYEAAVLELDRQRLPMRIEEARQAILRRLHDITGEDVTEKEPLTNALHVLQDLGKIGAEDATSDAA